MQQPILLAPSSHRLKPPYLALVGLKAAALVGLMGMGLKEAALVGLTVVGLKEAALVGLMVAGLKAAAVGLTMARLKAAAFAEEAVWPLLFALVLLRCLDSVCPFAEFTLFMQFAA